MNSIYALSADPITYGHINIIERAANISDKLYVAIGDNPSKKYLFTKKERVLMAKKALKNVKNVEIVSFEGLLVDYAHTRNIDVIIRGVRSSEDMAYEKNLYFVNDSQDLDIETICLFSKEHLSNVSSSNVKALQKENGCIKKYVPLIVKDKLELKISNKKFIGITGLMGSGKSFVGRELEKYSKKTNIPIHNIELDDVAKFILYESEQLNHKMIREKILERFKTLDKKEIAKIIFNDNNELNFINKILKKPLDVELRKITRDLTGIILVNSAIIIESNMLDYVNGNLIIINSKPEFKYKNLLEFRSITEEQEKARSSNVLNLEDKIERLIEFQSNNNCGHLFLIENNKELIKKIPEYYQDIIKFYTSGE